MTRLVKEVDNYYSNLIIYVLMRKIFLYAMLTAGVLSSCSQSEEEGIPGGSSVDLAPGADVILLSASTPSVSASVAARSAGTVGADGAVITNKWSGQTLHIFACPKNAKTGETREELIGNIPGAGNNAYALYNEPGTVEADEASSAVKWRNNESRYFPRTGAYDFFGYYADDAAPGAPKAMEIGGKTVLCKDFTINGAQDLMIAKAALSDADKTLLGNKKEEEYKAYSSYTARKGVQPKMKFEHLLTRLVFSVRGMGDAKPENVSVESIKVKSRHKGQLVFVYSDAKDKGLHWSGNAPADYTYLSLQERVNGRMQALPSGKYFASPKDAPAPTQVGEALLVEPGREFYEIELTVKQMKDEAGNTPPVAYQTETYTLKLQAKDVMAAAGGSANLSAFAASASYNVTIAVYGIETVKLEATLGEWTEGGNIEVNPDDFQE